MPRRRDDEPEIRLRPPKPKVRNDGMVWAIAFKRIIHYARISRKASAQKAGVGSAKAVNPARARFQRCAVRVSYSGNATAGQWRAHGRYAARESATIEDDQKTVGFTGEGKGIDMAARLNEWQAAGDERLWKLILSPEFGDRIDLERLTREVMNRMQQDAYTQFEWVAVVHQNTEHPHVHVALRGKTADGRQLKFGRGYIKEEIRAIAEDYCTQQLGYRTELDAAEAERREIKEKRFTSLDRSILRRSRGTEGGWLSVGQTSPAPGSGPEKRHEAHLVSRLAVLQTMGLARNMGGNGWQVRADFEGVLRAMQRAADHQKTLNAHGVLMSDERLSIAVLDWRQTPAVEGRVLVHGQEDTSGRSYVMLEGTEGRVHFVYYTPEVEAARAQGRLRTNSFVRLRRLFVDGSPSLETEDLGRADDLLKNREYLHDTAQKVMRQGIIPAEDGWGGWLGKYQAAVCEAASRLEDKERETLTAPIKQRRRDRDRSHGR
jgi:type IV secretory pathway VirD2 relaxase